MQIIGYTNIPFKASTKPLQKVQKLVNKTNQNWYPFIIKGNKLQYPKVDLKSIPSELPQSGWIKLRGKNDGLIAINNACIHKYATIIVGGCLYVQDFPEPLSEIAKYQGFVDYERV